MAKLTIVPTPIGNLEDITLRALSTLKRVRLILAEDTRTTGVLLAHFGIKCPLQSHHMHNEHKTLDTICRRIEEYEDVALVSDAGTPAISDPGFLLVRECIRRGIEVECLPGPTAFVPALVASGLPCDRFAFEGFLPQKKGRQTKLKELATEERTVILYESPFRVVKTLTQLAEYKGEDCPAVACRELSKLHEEFVRGTLKELIGHFQQTPPKGEFVLIIGKSTTFDTAK
ncbi:MAG: 16S rRNA (cytidine(1402)-2'-O)-methyltransferase [Porphyromonadaceae bacterium]|nr:16S rRNA (cytidine(1402)-2'-O)-methyltransferase [Porphyromonadaceae bacterium]